MKKYLTFLLIILTNKIDAQQSEFSKVYFEDTSYYGISAYSITSTYKKNYIIVGEVFNKGGLILKIDSLGNIQWNRIIKNSTSDVFTNVIATNDSCFIIAGKTYDTLINKFCIIYTKINSDGGIQWSKTLNFNNYDLNLSSIKQTNDSGFIITGYTNESTSPYYRILVAKTDINGQSQWIKFLTDNINANYSNSIEQTLDSGFIVSGIIGGYPDAGGLLIKLSPIGTITWAKKYPYSYFYPTYGNNLIVEDDGYTCYLGGSILIKTDFSGSIQWSKLYEQGSQQKDYLSYDSKKLIKTSEGHYYICNSSIYGSSLIKTDSVGNGQYIQILDVIFTDMINYNKDTIIVVGNGPVWGSKKSIYDTPHFGIIESDFTNNSYNNCSNYNYSVTTSNQVIQESLVSISTLSEGFVSSIYPNIDSLSILSDVGCVGVLGNIKKNSRHSDFSIYPNPVDDNITIVSNINEESVEISIYSVYSQKLLQFNLSTQYKIIDFAKYSCGIYFIKFKTEKNNYVIKFIKKG